MTAPHPNKFNHAFQVHFKCVETVLNESAAQLTNQAASVSEISMLGGETTFVFVNDSANVVEDAIWTFLGCEEGSRAIEVDFLNHRMDAVLNTIQLLNPEITKVTYDPLDYDKQAIAYIRVVVKYDAAVRK